MARAQVSGSARTGYRPKQRANGILYLRNKEIKCQSMQLSRGKEFEFLSADEGHLKRLDL